MSAIESKTGILKLRNYFAIGGLFSTIIAAILLVLLYRHMAISDIVTLGERNNLVLAETVLNSVKHELIDYLADERKGDTLPDSLNRAIENIMGNSSVIKINIFDMKGTVVFSTRPSLIGVNESDNRQFRTAIDGQVTSRLIYNDSFSFFRDRSDDDNMVQSYLPVRATSTSPIHGVFEIYTEVQFVVDRVERTEALVFFSVFLILLILYSFLFMVVRISANTIEHQQSIIQDRTRTLELLSSQMLNAHETEKKKIANRLHEGIAQTLAAVKNNTELAYAKLQNELNEDQLAALQQNIAYLQETIQDIRTLTMELRPPSLDDFGLVKTIIWLGNEYQDLYPNITIDTACEIDESNLPGSLKSLIYRVVQETLANIMRIGVADRIRLQLLATQDSVALSIEDNALPYHGNEIISIHNATISAFAVMKERTLLSGGDFTIEGTRQGGTLAKATWSY